jgi:S1-C subfamily serine protease
MKVSIQMSLMAALLLLASNLTNAALPVAVDGEPLPTLAPMLAKVRDAVVNKSTESEIKVRRSSNSLFNDPFFRRFSIKTAHNVVANAKGLVQVLFLMQRKG